MTTPAFAPTEEQSAALDVFRARDDLVLQAGAGSGKTSTLNLLARADRRRGIYLAYNKAIAQDAARRFPDNVECRTAHSLAFRAVGRAYAHRLSAPRQPAREQARLLGITTPLPLPDGEPVSPALLARLVMRTVQRFCESADPEPGRQHAPTVAGLDGAATVAHLAPILVEGARRAWADLTRTDGALRFSHDHYLKIWQLSRPRLPGSVVLFDEAQDASPVILDVVTRQAHAQRVLVGDRAQAIYGWRGAVDALGTFPDATRLRLSQSFRFGPVIATEANKWLQLLGEPMRITGHPPIASRVSDVPGPVDAILCRSNSRTVMELVAAHRRGQPVHLVGDGRDITRLAHAAVELQNGEGTSHPELCGFTTWGQVQDYVENDHGGRDLKTFVSLIDTHGPAAVIDAVERTVPDHQARLVVSTAHKAKGREWPRVRIADDFTAPRGTEIPRPEAMLAYVAVTRARELLVTGGLNWVDEWLDDEPTDTPPEHHRSPPPPSSATHTSASGVAHAPAPRVAPEQTPEQLAGELYRRLIAETTGRSGTSPELVRCRELAAALLARLRGEPAQPEHRPADQRPGGGAHT